MEQAGRWPTAREISEERLLVLEGAATAIGDADASEVAAAMLGLSVVQMKRTGTIRDGAQRSTGIRLERRRRWGVLGQKATGRRKISSSGFKCS
jgi:hypothetical protein